MTTTDTDLRARLVELEAENRALRAQLEGDFPTATRWLQTKVWRQRTALDRLNRRVANQRAALRAFEAALGRPLTDDEWQAVRESVTAPATIARLDEKAPAAA